VRTVIYSMGVSLDCHIAGPDGDDWGGLMPSCTGSTTSRQASSASIYSDDASTTSIVARGGVEPKSPLPPTGMPGAGRPQPARGLSARTVSRLRVFLVS
jgi:hypothetical protein